MIEVIDNFLPQEHFDKINETVMGSYFPWYTGQILDYNFTAKEKHNLQLTHQLYLDAVPQSQHYEMLGLFLPKLSVATWFSAKWNMNFNYSKIVEHGYHCDNPNKNCMTAVYYLNTNDGYTKFATGEKVDSVSNRIVIFPTQTEHTGTTCTNTDRRVVLNLNFFPVF